MLAPDGSARVAKNRTPASQGSGSAAMRTASAHLPALTAQIFRDSSLAPLLLSGARLLIFIGVLAGYWDQEPSLCGVVARTVVDLDGRVRESSSALHVHAPA